MQNEEEQAKQLPGDKKKRVLKKMRNILISFIVLTVLFVGAGFGYTWYMGQNGSAGAEVQDVQQANALPNEIKHVKPADNVPESASIQMLASPVKPGDNSSVSVRTNPDSVCKIKVEYDKIASKDAGLITKNSDEFGTVSWSWTVEKTAPLGKWPVTITCTRNKKSAVVVGDLVVSNKIQN